VDIGIAIGVALMVLGGILIFSSFRGSQRNKVHASGGSVAVGGNNSGPIINTNVHAPSPAHTPGVHWLTVIGIIVELAGIGVTVWHAMHLAAA
jgi:hypothetical protein